MPKDNENIPFLNDEPLAPSEPPGFAHGEMVRCEECLRTNPPTRVSCLYCAATLPSNEDVADQRKPVLGPIDDSTQGYNTILVSQPANEPNAEVLNKAANLLRLSPAELNRIIGVGVSLPLARTATLDEATLVSRRLKALGIDAMVVSDKELQLKESPPVRVRALDIDEKTLSPKHIARADEIQITWEQVVLIVTGRVVTKRVESKAGKGRRGTREIVDASEFFADDAVVDIYSEKQVGNLRIFANSFDFSCLVQKRPTAAENFSALLRLFRERASKAEYDDLYNSSRMALEVAWPSGQQTGSRGWRREGLGKYSIESVIESSNEIQFTRYARLRHFLKLKAALDHAQSHENH